jgi:hypothetical protein
MQPGAGGFDSFRLLTSIMGCSPVAVLVAVPYVAESSSGNLPRQTQRLSLSARRSSLAFEVSIRLPGLEKIVPATVLEVEIREPSTKHAISLQQVERWLAGASPNPSEARRKAKLKMLLVQR